MDDEGGHVPVLALDGSGNILHANEAARTLLSTDSASLGSATRWRWLPDPERGRLQQACREALEGDKTVEFEIPLRREDRWYRLVVFPIEGNLSVHFQDVTDERRATTELQLRERSLQEACEIVTDMEADPRERIKRLLSTLRGTLGSEFATLSYIDTDEGSYHFDAVGADNEQALPEGETVPLEELPICSRVAQKEQTLVLNDVEEEAPGLVDETWGISAYLGSPVRVGGEVYGTFCFYSTERRKEAFTDWEVTYLELFSDFAAAELDRLVTDAVTVDSPILSGPSDS